MKDLLTEAEGMIKVSIYFAASFNALILARVWLMECDGSDSFCGAGLVNSLLSRCFRAFERLSVNALFLEGFADFTRSIQSTGHGGMHNSQPIHSSVITVCIWFWLPSIASTGQAWMHLVQPMHSDSRIATSMLLNLHSWCCTSLRFN